MEDTRHKPKIDENISQLKMHAKLNQGDQKNVKIKIITVCSRSSDPFYIISYYIKWVITSLTYSITAQVNLQKERPQ